MRKTLLIIVCAVIIWLIFYGPGSLMKVSKQDVIKVATEALNKQGIAVGDATVVYDEGNKIWHAWGEIVAKIPNDPNRGNLPHGMLKNKRYSTVYFDFKKQSDRDIWVFVDQDTNSVLAIYEVK